MTVAAATVARAFGASLENLSKNDIEAVIKFVETILVTGEESSKDAVATGFLESLLSQASIGAIDFRKISGVLGPESLKFCREWDEFTGMKTEGLWEASTGL